MSIHSEESIRFMVEEVGVGQWHEKLMAEGLQLEFEKQPGQYYEPNNKSAEQHMEVVREKVAGWLAQGYVEKLEERAWCTNPLTVAAKFDAYKQEVKYRPCIDLSRHVNKHIKKVHVKLDDLDSAEQLIEQGDFLTAFDLENQFFHVYLRPEDRKYFGFAVPDEKGQLQYYQFAVMAYGYAPAVAIVTKLLQPLKAYLYKRGIKLTLYVDDGRIIAKTEKQAIEQLKTALLVLQLAGWNIQWGKTNLEASQRQLHLGYITDTVQMKYFYPEEKKKLFKQQVGDMLRRSRAGESIGAREWASALGKLQSMRRSHGKVVQVMARACQHALGAAVSEGGWEAQVQPQEDTMREMTYWLSYLDGHEGQQIQRPGQQKRVRRLKDNQVEMQKLPFTDRRIRDQFYQEEKVFVYTIEGRIEQRREANFKEDRGLVKDVIRELKAMQAVMEKEKKQLEEIRGGTWVWETDSYTVARMLQKGAKNPAVQKELVRICFNARERGIQVEGRWCAQDTATRELEQKLANSTDEWGVDRAQLARVLGQLGIEPQVDCMASAYSSICVRFFAKGKQAAAEGEDFFAQELQQGIRYFCCPPVKLAFKAAKKLVQKEGVTSVLVLPEWESAPYWIALKEDRQFQQAVKQVERFKAELEVFNRAESVFSRCKTMRMVAFKLVAGKQSKEII
jgi:hypothetical protein